MRKMFFYRSCPLFVTCHMLFFLVSYPVAAQEPSPVDHDSFLDEVQQSSFRYFKEQHHPHTGLVRDSAPNRSGVANNAPASIAGVGFALTAYPVAVERGWMSRTTAYALTVQTLEFFLHHARQHKGFFYHFLNFETGERASHSELSPIDTALFLAGALFAAEYYNDAKIRSLVRKIYERVDFPWMLNNGKTFALAWSPETGFNKARWDHFDESLLLYVLAIGSPIRPVSVESWREILRPVGSYRDYRLIQMPPLFTHQYPHVWLDLRGQNDGLADYFENSVNASRANRAFCIDQASKFAGYGPNLWGLSASDGPAGYRAYGAPPGWTVLHDGTVAPTACGSSIVFTPKESIACLENIRAYYSDAMWGPYGFSDAMNVGKGWFSDKVLAIDQGPLLLMIENYRTGLIWKFMAQSAPIRTALEKIGFRKGAWPLPWPEPPVYHAPYVSQAIRVDGLLKDWPPGGVIVMNSEKHKNSGDFDGPGGLRAEVRFAWNGEYLYFVAKVNDDDVVVKRAGKHIWRDDLFEIYVDPAGNGLFWNDPRDYQLGFRPGRDDKELTAWSWFQGGEDPLEKGMVLAKSYTDEKGYIIEGAIRWDFLGVTPEPGKEIRLSPAVHGTDRKGGDEKLVWFFRNEEKYQRFVLGKVVLGETGEIWNAKT
ncbi:MAG: glucoamylase family protein [Candidatus Omnitrophota bacterium]